MKISKKLYGKLSGKEVYLYTLDNGRMSVGIITYGGIITSLKVPDKNSKKTDIVLGFKDFDAYLEDKAYLGAIIGRTSGRIADGKFRLNGKIYQLAKNEGGLKNLHGGTKGFDKYVWEAAEQKSGDFLSLTLSRLSPDGEEGFPGNLNVVVTYKLSINNEFTIEYTGTTDKDTPVVLTNHSYFNLNGEPSKKDILNNVLRVEADHFVPIDKTSIPLGKFESVSDTPMDFRKEITIGKRIDDDFAQTMLTRGYDHPWALNAPSLKKASICAWSPVSGIKMDVYTDQAAVVIYTSNYMDETKLGKSGFPYPKRYAFCLETQGFPDSVNQPNFPNVIATSKKPYKQKTIWKFSTI